MSLYCPKCKVWAYKTHKCSINSLIPIKRGCQSIVNTLCTLGLEVMCAAWYADPVPDSFEYSILIGVEFRQYYHPCLFASLPAGWHWQETTFVDSKCTLSTLVYEEKYLWLGFESAEERIKQILSELESHISSIDKVAFNAMLTLATV